MSELFGFLYARPSIAEGIGRLVDFGGTLTEYNRSLTPEQADAIAMNADWQTVGDDIMNASTWVIMQPETEHVTAANQGQ